MSIVCTLKRDQLPLPTINVFASGFGATTNLLLLQESPALAAAGPQPPPASEDRSILSEQHRMMVAEFVERQHSTGSPIKGETAHQHHSISDLPDTPPSIHPSTAGVIQEVNNSANNTEHPNHLLQLQHPHRHIHVHPAHITSISPSLAISRPPGVPMNVHSGNMLLSSLHEPLSPQSSDGGNSLSEHVHQLNSNSSCSSSNGKFGSGGASPSGSNAAFEMQHITKQQHKELFTQRKQREFIPDNKKDDSYWDRRRRNNEAAKRSREKRRYNDMVLEQRVVELTKENHVLKAQLDAIRDKFNIAGESLVSVEQIMASLPTSEQVLSITKRAKLSPTSLSTSTAAGGSAVMPTVICGSNGQDLLQTEQPLQPQMATAGRDSAEHIASDVKQHLQKVQNLRSGGVVVGLRSQLHTSHLATACAHHPVQHYALHSEAGSQNPSPVSTKMDLDDIATCGTAQSLTALPKTSPLIEEANSLNQHPHHRDQVRGTQFHPSHNQMQSHAPHNNNNNRVSALQNLQVLKTLNRNVSGDDIDSLRKVAAVVGAITANVSKGTAAVASGSEELSTIYQPPMQSHFANKQHVYNYTSLKDSVARPPPTSSTELTCNEGTSRPRPEPLSPPHPAAVDAVSSALSNVSPAFNNSCISSATTSVLNLSRRASTHNYELLLSSAPSPSLSSSVCSGIMSGDDEHEGLGDDEHEGLDDHEAVDESEMEQERAAAASISPAAASLTMTAISVCSNNDGNNSLPLKLRHKSHLGDKDAAATALLALHHIKQEPISSHLSPPSWADNGDNSSDERDSGISLGSNEWAARSPRKIVVKNAVTVDGCANAAVPNTCTAAAERDHILKSQLARLENEVANIKNMMILTSSATAVPTVAGATATAQ